MDLESRYVHRGVARETWKPDGTKEVLTAPAVWTLAHLGYSGSGRLDVWVYPTKEDALKNGADLAMESGLDEDHLAVQLYNAGKYEAVLARHEELSPRPNHLLRVQEAFLQGEHGPLTEEQPPHR